MFQSKCTKQNPYLLVLFSSWIFCSFLKFLQNVKAPLTLWRPAAFGISKKKTPKCMWLCMGISLVR